MNPQIAQKNEGIAIVSQFVGIYTGTLGCLDVFGATITHADDSNCVQKGAIPRKVALMLENTAGSGCLDNGPRIGQLEAFCLGHGNNNLERCSRLALLCS